MWWSLWTRLVFTWSLSVIPKKWIKILVKLIQVTQQNNLQDINMKFIFVHIMHRFKEDSNIFKCIKKYTINCIISLWILYMKAPHIWSSCSHPMISFTNKKHFLQIGIVIINIKFFLKSTISCTPINTPICFYIIMEV